MRVLILGLGQYPKGSGVSAAMYFARRGDEVTVADFYYTKAMDANVKRLKKYSNVKFILGKHATDQVSKADLIVRHQRLRHDEPELVRARKLGKSLESELTIFLKECPARVIGITGTRGKSTTTALLAEMLRVGATRRVASAVRHIWLGGNILISPLTFLSRVKPDDFVVLEMSSFQLEGLGERVVSPPVALVTNFLRDHLNTYSNMRAYAEAKAQIFLHQKKDGVVFLPADPLFNAWAKRAPGRVIRFGKDPEAALVEGAKMKLLGEHNQKNAEAATAVALSFGVSVRDIKRALSLFRGLPNRLEWIATKRGIRFMNDSASTTPDATIVAIQATRNKRQGTGRIHLIFGGADKKLIFDELAREIKQRRVSVTLLSGTAHGKIVKAFRRVGVVFRDAQDLRDAIRLILQTAKRGDSVLLSPGCASFGEFKNEFDRGRTFNRFVRAIR